MKIAVLDQKKLDQIRHWKGKPNPELFQKVIRLFLGQMSSLSKALLEAADKGELNDVVEIAHTLKSSSGTVGAMVLMELCRQIELSCEQGKLDMALVQRVQDVCNDVDVALNKELSEII